MVNLSGVQHSSQLVFSYLNCMPGNSAYLHWMVSIFFFIYISFNRLFYDHTRGIRVCLPACMPVRTTRHGWKKNQGIRILLSKARGENRNSSEPGIVLLFPKDSKRQRNWRLQAFKWFCNLGRYIFHCYKFLKIRRILGNSVFFRSSYTFRKGSYTWSKFRPLNNL